MNALLIGIVALIAISLPISWLIAEIRDASRSIRLALGLGIILFLLGVPIVMNDVYVIRQHKYDACITRIAELIDKDDRETVKQAMAVWNRDRGETTIGNLDRVAATLNKDAETK